MSDELLIGRAVYKVGDAKEALSHLADGYFQTCITSVPFWNLRDYGVDGQIGRENDPRAYVDKLVAAFAEVHRVLKPDGTLWVELGDTYTGGRGGGWKGDERGQQQKRFIVPKGMKLKDLVGVPWLFAFAMRDWGWYLRQEIIWDKSGNVVPEPAKDRPVRAHSTIFLFSKARRYYYDREAVKEPRVAEEGLRYLRSVWHINTYPYRGEHRAAWPPQLAQRMIRLSTRPGDTVLDPFAGTGVTGIEAQRLGRNAVLIDIDKRNVEQFRERLSVLQRSVA